MASYWLALFVMVHAAPIQGRLDIDADILTRLQSLERQVSEQQHQLHQHSIRMADQASVITEQKATIASQQATIQELKETLVEQQTHIARLQMDLDHQQSRVRRLERNLAIGDATKQGQSLPVVNAIPSLKDDDHEISNQTNTRAYHHSPTEAKADEKRRLKSRLVLDGGAPVAFHAVNIAGENAHVGVGQKIVFDNALLNIGSSYSTQHNVFTAPEAGLYIFSTSIMSYNNAHPEVQAALLKNGVTLARAYGHGDSGRLDQGSVTVVTQLDVGDTVWVSLLTPADDSYYGGYFTSFMGCLLWPMG